MQTSSAAILRSFIPVLVVILVTGIDQFRPVFVGHDFGWYISPRPTIPTVALLTLELERTLTVAELIVFDTHIHGLGEETRLHFPPSRAPLCDANGITSLCVTGIDPNHSGFHDSDTLFPRSKSLVRTTGKPVSGVGNGDSLFLTTESVKCNYGTKYFLGGAS